MRFYLFVGSSQYLKDRYALEELRRIHISIDMEDVYLPNCKNGEVPDSVWDLTLPPFDVHKNLVVKYEL